MDKSNWGGLERTLMAIMVACAVIAVGIMAYREFFANTRMAGVRSKPTYVPEWESHLAKGITMGPDDARVQILEISDFECPGCARYQQVLREITRRYPHDVAVTYLPYPLDTHPHATEAAIAAECANEQGNFEAMRAILFERQRSFGIRSWVEIAMEAGIHDVRAFDACTKDTNINARISAAKEIGRMIGLRATPTIVINGWKYTKPPTANELDQMIGLILAEKSPISG